MFKQFVLPLLAGTLLTSLPHHQAMAAGPDIIQAAVAELRQSGREEPGHYQAVAQLYEQLDYQLVWQDTELIRQLEAEIANIAEDGLNPDDYPLPHLNISSLAAAESHEHWLGQRDVIITDIFLMLLSHLYYGKVDPISMHAEWNLEDLRKLDESLDVILVALNNKDIASLLEKVRPQQQVYQELKDILLNYRKIAKAGGWPVITTNRVLKIGDTDQAIDQLRQRLALSGDLRQLESADPYRFDDEVEQAVIGFQKRHQLDADGVVGPATLAAMNIPVEQRIDQIRVNLERMRWTLKGVGDDFLIVDIAGFEVLNYRGDKLTWSSDAQVGRPYRQTPVFSGAIRYLEWNPTWTVPPTILNQDILPKIKQDPSYLKRTRLSVLTHQGERVDPNTVNWSLYPDKPFPYLLRQEPGPGNAMGTVKFIFPNEHLIFLHDTPSQSLFERSSRAFSSGCVRVAKPYELAELLLGEQLPMDEKAIDAILETGKTQRIYLDKPYPVVLLYWTAKPVQENTVVFAQDIYKRDDKLLKALNSGT